MPPITLVFNAGALQYNATVNFPELTDESRTKVCLIEDANKIQLSLVGEPLSPAQFNDFYDLPVDELQRIVNDQSNVLARRMAGFQ